MFSAWYAGGRIATRTARSSGTPCSTSASRRAWNASASRPPSRSGRAVTTCWATTPKKSTVPSLSMGGRRLLISHRDARSTSVRISRRIRVWTAAEILLS